MSRVFSKLQMSRTCLVFASTSSTGTVFSLSFHVTCEGDVGWCFQSGHIPVSFPAPVYIAVLLQATPGAALHPLPCLGKGES